MRAGISCLLLACAVSGSALANTWSDLWATPEQQAQHLLDSRHAAAAAPMFHDPRRRGYAELRAGQYAQAAKSLAPLHDADSLYNRGNALAHTGQLRDALAAYDAALKQSPGNSDIVHNRDLVERALQQQSAKNQQGGGSGKQQQGAGGQPGGAGPRQGQGGGQPGKNDDRGASGGPQTANSASQPSGHEPGKQEAQANSRAGKPSGNSAQAGTPQSASDAQPGGASQQQRQASAQQGAASSQHQEATSPQHPGLSQQPASSQQSAASAQQQGAASPQQPAAASEPAGAQNGAGSDPNSAAFADDTRDARGTSKSTTPPNLARRDTRVAGNMKPPPPPRSEQSLALDQWLRGIPDDSGELLRRKFLIEHMMTQQRNPP